MGEPGPGAEVVVAEGPANPQVAVRAKLRSLATPPTALAARWPKIGVEVAPSVGLMGRALVCARDCKPPRSVALPASNRLQPKRHNRHTGCGATPPRGRPQFTLNHSPATTYAINHDTGCATANRLLKSVALFAHYQPQRDASVPTSEPDSIRYSPFPIKRVHTAKLTSATWQRSVSRLLASPLAHRPTGVFLR